MDVRRTTTSSQGFTEPGRENSIKEVFAKYPKLQFVLIEVGLEKGTKNS